MSDEPTATGTQKVSSSSILWSTVNEETDPSPEDRTEYVFSNGRTFERPK